MRSQSSKTRSQGPPASKSDWLAPTIVAAKIITAAGECLPFPYVKGAFGMVVILLETVEKVKKNRDDLKELCTTAMEIMYILQDQISLHGDTGAVKLKGLCKDFERFLEDVIHGVEEMRKKPQGLRAHIKEFVKSSSIQDKIVEYQKNIQEICSRLKLLAAIDTNFQVHKINATLATVISPSNILISIVLLRSDLGLSDITVVQAARQMNNCPPPSRIFQGRQTILDKMNQFFAQDIGKQHIYVLYGLGGAGKTQIALSLSTYPKTIDAGLKIIASLKNVGNTSQDALKWLANNQEDWLLFYDNADDPKIDLNRFIPQCTHGNIIITTRNPALRSYAGAHSAVSDMEESDAVELLLKSASQEIILANQEIATKIVKAGAFILQSGALGGYLNIYMKNRAQLLREKPAQSHDNYAWTVYTTWQMSFDKLTLFISPLEGISEDIFSRAAACTFEQVILSREALQKPLEFLAQFLEPAGEWDTLHFQKVTNEIKAYSLMTFDPKRKSFSIHPLVHSWSRTTITDEQSHHSIMVAIMGMSIHEIPNDLKQLASLSLISHINFLRHVKQDVMVDFASQYGIIYYNVAHYEEAKRLYLAQLSKQKQVLGDDHPHTLWVMEYLALTYEGLGQYKQAEELQVVVLEKQKLVLGDHHPHTLRAMGSLASTYHHLGKFHKAEELEVVVLDEWKQDLGDGHPDTLQAMGNLASTYHDLGNFQQAEQLEVVVLEKRKQVLGDDHPDTLQAMGNLALTYKCLGKFKQAEELEFPALKKQKQLLGDDHPHTLRAMGNLAATYWHLGKFQQAEELEVVVLEKRKQVLGDDHPDTLRAVGNLALTYKHLGKFQQAEELQFPVLEKHKQLLGDAHPDTLQAMGNLATTYSHLGKFQHAEELEVVVLEKQKQVLGDDHPDTLLTMGNLVATYRDIGKFQQAEELEVVVLEKRKQVLGDDHPDTLWTMGNLAGTYTGLGKFQQAEELELVVLEKWKQAFGDGHLDTLRAMGNLGCTYHRLGQFEKAEELQFIAIEKSKMVLGANHPDTLRTMRNLALTYRCLDKLSEAEELETLVGDHEKALKASANE
ncbi:hypothetical protein B0H13DRAFT_2283893 [Mycena leptocephala]|nr:hypothetical protein B0H13DRAFT_2283893 [Mycena leptocephala]